jgi:hypothetical protein
LHPATAEKIFEWSIKKGERSRVERGGQKVFQNKIWQVEKEAYLCTPAANEAGQVLKKNGVAEFRVLKTICKEVKK